MIQTFYTFIILFFLSSSSWSAQLQINTQIGKNGDMVTFTVFIHNSPDPVNAFGFEITYDPTSMIYKSVQRGALISNGFRFFQASNVGLGRIRIGGIETGDDIIQKQAIGSLALIQFSVIGDTNSFVRLENLKDDFKTWTTQDGQLIIQSEETENNDVNETEENSEDDIVSDPEKDTAVNINSDLSSSEASVTTTLSEFPYVMNNDNTQANISYSPDHLAASNSQRTTHKKISYQSKAKKNQQIGQIVALNHEDEPHNINHKQQPVDRRYNTQTQSQQPDFNNNIRAESLKNRDWGHIKPVDVSAGMYQHSAISQNHVFTFPSFLSLTIVISMIIQTGILIILFLIYRQLLKKNKEVI